MDFRDSKQASVVSVIALGLAFPLLRLGYINARTGMFGLEITLALYIVGLVLAVTSLGFAAIYARSRDILAMGMLILGALYVALDRIDDNYLTYLLHKTEYQATVAKIDRSGPKFVIFTLHENAAFPAGGAWEYIVFDSTDEIGLPENQRDEQWKRLHSSFVRPLASGCEVTIRRLEGQFFYVEHLC
jgi:hypothetical protein